MDDWDLMEVNPDCDLADGSASSPPPPPPLLVPPASIYQACCFKVMRNKLHRMNELHRTPPVKPDTPLPPRHQFPYRRNLSQFSSASSSDFGPSLDGSIESGPLSDLQSDEDEGRRSADRYLQVTAPPLARRGGASVAAQLLEDVQSRDANPDVWRRMEVGTSS